MATTESVPSSNPTDMVAVAAARPKRVRTGCLTCRERHLKCDEGLPDCQNCKKSNRPCKRGVRLNFIDTTVKSPPITQPARDWDVTFHDESREIASEYQGGLHKYAYLVDESLGMAKDEQEFDFPPAMVETPVLPHQRLPSHPLPSQHAYAAGGGEPYARSMQQLPDPTRDPHHRHASTTSDSTFSNHTLGASSVPFTNGDQTLTPPSETRELLRDPEELLYMQVFIEEVGIWMDSMDPYKHFSRLLPFDSLGEPMLMNAFLACGARHLTLVNPAYQDAKAKHYYQASSTILLRQMQNPYRDSVIVATTAVILNVYEIMTERALQRMNHIAGARALIKECGWNAKSVGIGAACFWLNVGMELLSCLHFNWQVAWNPDDWGVDMDFTTATEMGREEIWTHRIVWIIAHIANFRAASTPRPSDPPQDHIRMQSRYDEWKRWKDWLDAWEASVPRTMQPLGVLNPYQTSSKSLFPEVWLVKRTTIVARMFYHTGICLLCETNPMAATNPQVMQEMHDWQMRNARELCGIVAHVKDRGVASVALRSLHIAAACLTLRAEQDEVLAVFDRIRKETGWRIDFIYDDLRKKWGHLPPEQSQVGYSALPPAPPPRKMPVGIINPTYAKADFGKTDHPYEGYYVRPIERVPGASQHTAHTAYPHY